jgi:outer membrane scaffolding protein for murein synthesis (MipA/OmpV family)
MMKVLRLLCVVMVVLILTTGTVWAGKYTVGLGAGMAPEFEGSDDLTVVPMLMLRGNYNSGQYFTLMGTNFKLNVIPDERFSFGPSLNYRKARDGAGYNQGYKIKDVDAAYEIGAFGSLNLYNFLLGLEYLADVSNTHDGWVTIANAGYKWNVNEVLTITPGIFSTYASDDYMLTYFDGVKGSYIEAGIKDVGANVIVHYTPWQQWGIMGVLSYSEFVNDSDAKRSPVVEEDKQMSFGLMATYRWDDERRRGRRRR